MTFKSMHNLTCNVYTHDTTTDAYGDKNTTWSLAHSGLLCRVSAKRASYKSSDEVKYTRPSYIIGIYPESGVDINEGDRIEVASLSQDFIVTFAKMDSSLHHWSIEAEDMDTIN